MTSQNGKPAQPAAPAASPQHARRRPRRRGSGGVFPLREGAWRVDVEIARDAVSGRRRRVSRTVVGTREEAEIALARLKVADHEKRLPSGGTNARSVRAAFQLYQQAIDAGLVELAPRTRVTTRSAAKTMGSVLLPDGRAFGDIRLSRLTWQDIEELYAAMRAPGGARRGCADAPRSSTGPRSWPASAGSWTPIRPRMQRGRERLVANRSRPRAGRCGRYWQGLASETPRLLILSRCCPSTEMRVGEVIGLRWSDVELSPGEVHSARTAVMCR
jgi:integrase